MTDAPVPERVWIVRDIAGPTVVATGARLPSGTIVVEWRRAAFPVDEQTDNPVRSHYQTVDDAREATSGDVVFLDDESVLDHTDVDPDALIDELEEEASA